MEKKRKVVFTAIFGDYDILKLQPKQTIDTDFVCFTDNADLQVEALATDQRKIVVCERQWKHTRYEAKRYRTHPTVALPEYDQYIYIDGSARLLSHDSIEQVLKQHGTNDLTCFPHPLRQTIQAEAEATIELNYLKYQWLEDKMLEQVAHYKKSWFPDNIWLSATWLIVSNNNVKTWKAFDDRWIENIKRTYQDQLSFEYIIRKHKLKRWHLKENLWNNNIVDFLSPHKSLT